MTVASIPDKLASFLYEEVEKQVAEHRMTMVELRQRTTTLSATAVAGVAAIWAMRPEVQDLYFTVAATIGWPWLSW